MHATNENMAEVMGWQLIDGRYWYTITGGYTHFSNSSLDKGKYFNPTADLNHAALVEARLYQLGLVVEYMEQLLIMLNIDTDAYLAGEALPGYQLITATAQTRCDAAWAAYSAWKEQQK